MNTSTIRMQQSNNSTIQNSQSNNSTTQQFNKSQGKKGRIRRGRAARGNQCFSAVKCAQRVSAVKRSHALGCGLSFTRSRWRRRRCVPPASGRSDTVNALGAASNATHSTRGRSTVVLGALALGTQGCNPPRATYSNWLLLVLVVFGVECSFID